MTSLRKVQKIVQHRVICPKKSKSGLADSKSIKLLQKMPAS